MVVVEAMVDAAATAVVVVEAVTEATTTGEDVAVSRKDC